MTGPTIDASDDTVRSIRNDIQEIYAILDRMDARLVRMIKSMRDDQTSATEKLGETIDEVDDVIHEG